MFIPYVGTVYHFTFVSPFNVLDGIYSVDQVLTYNETVDAGEDLLQLYIKYGLTEADFNENINVLRSDKILKLTPIEKTDDTVPLYMPSSLSRLEPDPNVKKYAQLALGINLGVYDNIEKVNFVKSTMESIIAKGLGVNESAYIFSIKDTWMTVEEYNKQENERVEKKNGLVNLYSEVLRLRKELDSANVKVKYYEDLLIKLNTSTE